jgi:hypothetical protein
MGWFDPILSFCRNSVKVRTIMPRNLDLFEVVPSAPRIVDALVRRRLPAPEPGLFQRT